MKKTYTTSKKILFISYTLTIILTIITVICTLLQIECNNLVVVCGASWTELSIHTIVYSGKAKQENKQKIAYSMFKEMAEKYPPEIVAQVFDTVTRD